MEKPPERRKALVVRDALTPEEAQRRMEDMTLRHAREILKRRKERAKASKGTPKPKPRFTKRCKQCGAFKFLLSAKGMKK